MSDIGQSLTNSLPRNGSAPMVAPLDMNNNPIRNLSPGVDPTDAATIGQVTGVPLGVAVDYWGAFPPPGYAFLYGQELSRTTYADLFAVIGTAAGAGNGTTTFNLPDYRDVVSSGRGDMGGTAKGLLSNFASTVIGAIFGTQSHTLTEAQMPSHTHTGTAASAGSHDHTLTLSSTGNNGSENASVARFNAPTVSNWGMATGTTNTTGAHTHTVTVAAKGGGLEHPNVQPTIICNKIMRVE